MAKVQTTILVDDILFKKAKAQQLKLGQTLEEALRYKVAFNEQDLTSINKKQLQNELAKEEKSLVKTAAKVEGLKDTLLKIEQQEEEREKRELAQQEQDIKNKQSCTQCKNVIPEGDKIWYNVKEKGDRLCRSCFMSI